MSEWQEGTLSDIAEFVMGQSPEGETCNEAGAGVPLLNGPTEFGIRSPKAVQFTTYPKRFSKLGDILFCVRGSTTGKMNWSDQEYAIGRGLAAMRHKNGAGYKYFLKAVIDFNLELLLASATGSTFPNVSKDQIANLEVSIPPLGEQKAIASVLSSLDDKIDLLHRQNTTLERMVETLFRQWFVEEAQEEWEEVVITKLFEVRDGTHDSPKQKTIGKPLITSKHINGNRLDFESAYLISDEDFDKINQRSKVDKNDILISMIGTIGLIYLEQADTINYAIKNVGLFKTSQNPNWMAYTYFWLKSNLGKQFIDEHISGSTQEYVSLGSFRSITLKKPPIEKLEEFNKMANGNLHKIKNNSAQIQSLEKLRDNLLPKLMSGEVSVL